MSKLEEIAQAEEKKLELAEQCLEEDAQLFDEYLKVIHPDIFLSFLQKSKTYLVPRTIFTLKFSYYSAYSIHLTVICWSVLSHYWSIHSFATTLIILSLAIFFYRKMTKIQWKQLKRMLHLWMFQLWILAVILSDFLVHSLRNTYDIIWQSRGRDEGKVRQGDRNQKVKRSNCGREEWNLQIWGHSKRIQDVQTIFRQAHSAGVLSWLPCVPLLSLI